MQNRLINNKEREALQEIFKGVNKFIEAHNEVPIGEMLGYVPTATQVEKIHTLLYMSLVKNFIEDIGAIRGLFEDTEDGFIKTITDDGKLTLDEIEKKLMIDALRDALFNKQDLSTVSTPHKHYCGGVYYRVFNSTYKNIKRVKGVVTYETKTSKEVTETRTAGVRST